MPVILVFLGVILVIASLFSLLAMCARRAHNRHQQTIELHAPLIESDVHRLDAALKDAEEGYNVCVVCGFENFKRFQFCTVCGEQLDVDGENELQDGTNRRSSTKTKKQSMRHSLLPLFKRESRVQLVTTSARPASTRTPRRLVRAQRRKEWTRKMDVEGRAFWFRDGQHGVDMRFPGFALEFQPSTSSSNVETRPTQQDVASSAQEAASESSSPPRVQRDNGVVDPVSADTAHSSEEDVPVANSGVEASGSRSPQRFDITLVERIESLEKATAMTLAVLVPASDADASKMPLDVNGAGFQSVNEDAANNKPSVVNAEGSAAATSSGADLSPATSDGAAAASAQSTTTSPPLSTSLAASLALAGKDFPTKYADFVMSSSALLMPADTEHLRLNVERENLFRDSMESLAIIPIRNAHSILRINFLDESGVDAGGLHREWFMILNEMLVDPEHGLFVCTDKSEQTFYLNQSSRQTLGPRHLLYLFATGRLVGRALLEGDMMGFHLAPPLLKLMLGQPLSFADLEDLDPEVHSNLLWLLENDGVDALGLDFTVVVKDGDESGGYREVELVPGGNTMAVTDANKHEYVERKWQYLLVKSVAPQLQVFLQGLYEIVPRELLLLFDAQELDFLLCGSDEIDVDDWERNTKYTEGLYRHRALKWFWELVREMPNEYRRRLLLFATGSSRVPLAGFSALTSYDGRLCPFTLKAVNLVGDGFIHSHACFNRLDLPLHVVRDELKAVLYATLDTEDQYGFTTD